MKRFSFITTCLFIMALSINLYAQNPSVRGGKSGRQHNRANLKKMDANQDGTVTREEWKGKPGRFNKLDQNNDGIISKEEALNARHHRGKKHLRKIDANRDGQITRDEWQGKADKFSRLDKNNDGIISGSELNRRRRRS